MKDIFYTEDEKDDYNLIKSVRHILDLLHIKVTTTTLTKTLTKHAEFPRLTSVVAALQQWKTEVLVVEADLALLREIPCPVLSFVNDERKRYIVINKAEEDRILYFDAEKGNVEEDAATFNAKWSRVAVVIEAKTASGEADYAENLQREKASRYRKYAVSAFLLVTVLLTIFTGVGNGMYNPFIRIPLFFAKITGFILSYYLILVEMGNVSTIGRKVCNLSAKFNCFSVLNSPASKMIPGVTLADLGIIYFGGGTLSIVLSTLLNGAASVFYVHFILSALACLFTFYSIYYQALVIKKWCPLCLLVCLVLWGEFLIQSAQPATSGVVLNLSLVQLFLASYGSVILVWLVLKPKMIEGMKVQALDRELSILKSDPDIFRLVLTKQSLVTPLQFSKRFRWGSRNAKLNINAVINPLCVLCADTFNALDKIFENHLDKVHIDIIFKLTADANPATQRVVRDVLSLVYTGQINLAKQLLQRSFSVGVEKYALIYPEFSSWIEQAADQLVIDELVAQHVSWCHQNEINSTPVITVNGYVLPVSFDLEDVNNHLYTLAEF